MCVKESQSTEAVVKDCMSPKIRTRRLFPDLAGDTGEPVSKLQQLQVILQNSFLQGSMPGVRAILKSHPACIAN